MSRPARRVGSALRPIAAVVVGGVLASCGLFDVDGASITAMVGSVRADQAQLGQYFSFDRYTTGTGVDLDGPAGDVLDEVFSQRVADPTVGQPLAASLDSAWPERIVFDIASVDATYEQPGTSGPTLIRGRFVVDELSARIKRSVREQQSRMDDVQGDPRPLELTEGPGLDGFTLINLDGDVWPGAGITSGTSLAVSEDDLVVLPGSMSTSEVLLKDQDRSRLRSQSVRDVVDALDDAEVYAAVVSFVGVVFDGGEATLAGGFGTGIVDGEERSHTVLAHATEADVEANVKAVKALMKREMECDGPVEAAVHERLVTASCRSRGAQWAATVRDGFDGAGPFRFA